MFDRVLNARLPYGMNQVNHHFIYFEYNSYFVCENAKKKVFFKSLSVLHLSMMIFWVYYFSSLSSPAYIVFAYILSCIFWGRNCKTCMIFHMDWFHNFRLLRIHYDRFRLIKRLKVTSSFVINNLFHQ